VCDSTIIPDTQWATGVTLALAIVAMLLAQRLAASTSSSVAVSVTDAFHAASLSPLALFMVVFPLVNFSFCMFTAIVTVPVFLLLRPRAGRRIVNAVQFIMLLLLVSPAGLLAAVHWWTLLPIEHLWHTLLSNHVEHGAYGLLFLCTVYLPLSLSHLSLFVTNAMMAPASTIVATSTAK